MNDEETGKQSEGEGRQVSPDATWPRGPLPLGPSPHGDLSDVLGYRRGVVPTSGKLLCLPAL